MQELSQMYLEFFLEQRGNYDITLQVSRITTAALACQTSKIQHCNLCFAQNSLVNKMVVFHFSFQRSVSSTFNAHLVFEQYQTHLHNVHHS